MTQVFELEAVDSTNEFCKKLKLEDAIVTAKRQTEGKGTKGRSFFSEEGGLYLTRVRKYENFKYENTFKIMVNSCVAVCITLKSFGLNPTIKWANDVLEGGKKICGTLIENRLGADGVCTSIVGIGLNVNNPLGEELKGCATTMSERLGKKVNLKKVRDALVKNLQGDYSIEEYKSYIDWFGQEVSLDCNGALCTATAVDVDAFGNLVCSIGGKIKIISSAEMSLRLTCKSI